MAEVLEERRVALYVGGSVAAYKAAEVVTRFRKLGAEVKVAMTTNALRFITPITLQSLSGSQVLTSLWHDNKQAHGMSHIQLAEWAEVQVGIAVSANLLAKLALGLADDVVTTAALASRAPMILAPAMESNMWQHLAVQQHVRTLRDREAIILEPSIGRLASGKEDHGRMAEPSTIVDSVIAQLYTRDLVGQKVVITAGGTRENIDPVRFIGNHSSGKMGMALAEEAWQRGAEVSLVTTVDAISSRSRLKVVLVNTAREMAIAVEQEAKTAQLLVMAAAVADWQPAHPVEAKIKKNGSSKMELLLEATPDVLKSIIVKGQNTSLKVVAFAAETEKLVENAQRKLVEKNADVVVANLVGDGVGIGTDDNAVTIITAQGKVIDLPRQPKRELAKLIWDQLQHLVKQ